MGKQLIHFITCESSAPFLAHLAFRPCELLSSLFVRRPSVNISHFQLTWPLGHVSYCHHFSSVVRPSIFHILIFSSETIGPIATKLWWNGPWVPSPLKLCPVIPTSNQDGCQAKNNKKGGMK